MAIKKWAQPTHFPFFADWDPSALYARLNTFDDRYDRSDYYSPKDSILYVFVQDKGVFRFQLAVEFSMKNYPPYLGLLLLKQHGSTPMQLVKANPHFREKKNKWEFIQGCLEGYNLNDIVDFFVFAAVGKQGDLDLVYYLLCKDPHVIKRWKIARLSAKKRKKISN